MRIQMIEWSLRERMNRMNYNGTIYRPPIEANTFLIPVTEGCSHNTCTYCNMFSGIPFRPLPLSDIKGYLHEVDERYHDFLVRQERVYLVGGDPFVLSAAKLRALSEVIRRYLPKVGTISMYASIANIQRKSDAELAALRDAGVNDLYIGVESALSDVLLFLNKGTSAEEAAQCCKDPPHRPVHARCGGKGAGKGECSCQGCPHQ